MLKKKIHVYIGQAVRASDTVSREPLPDQMLELLAKLKEKEAADRSATAGAIRK